MEAIKVYSNGTMACANPYGQHERPYADLRALNIDHINNGGRKDPYGRGINLYLNLKKAGWPSGYQILCANCNTIKEYERRRTSDIDVIAEQARPSG